MKKKFVSILIALSLSLTSIVYADVNEDVERAQAQYIEYQNKIDDMTGEVIKLNSSIEEYLFTLEENNSKIESLNEEIHNSEILVAQMKEEIKKREELKEKRVREFYKSGGSFGYISAIIKFDSLYEFINKMESVNRIVNIDKDILLGIEEDKKEVLEKISEIEVNKSSIERLNSKVYEDSKVLKLKKLEQEEILVRIKNEQSKFSKEVLEVAERELISPQVDLVNSYDLGSLNSAVSQLTLIRDNQITSEVVKGEINNLISQASNKIVQINSMNNTQVAVISNPSRGDVNATGMDIVNYAYQFIGRKYVWGAIGPDTFDCSGLTSYVYRHCANREITRTTYTQINVGTPVSQSELQPGDLVFTFNNEHVGIYVGGGMYINATMPGDVVRVTPVTHFFAARRYL